jgi:hypothetical protein
MTSKRLMAIALGALALATTACTPSQINAWVNWHNSDPAAADAFLEAPEFQELSDDGLQQAARGEQQQLEAPPAPPSSSTASSNGQCVGFKGLLAQYNPGWSVDRMAGIMYRESRCDPSASNSCCSGLLQMHRMHVPVPECGVWSRNDLYNAEANVCAAAQLFRSSGYGAWSTS